MSGNETMLFWHSRRASAWLSRALSARPMRRVDVRQNYAPPKSQGLNRIDGRPVLLAWTDDWLHEHAGQLAPDAPLTERICPGVKDNNLLEILSFRSVVQPDGHAKLAGFCPALHERQVSDFEEKSSGRFGRRLENGHRALLPSVHNLSGSDLRKLLTCGNALFGQSCGTAAWRATTPWASRRHRHVEIAPCGRALGPTVRRSVRRTPRAASVS